MMYDKTWECIPGRRDEELDGIGNLMQLYKFIWTDKGGSNRAEVGLSYRF